MRDRNLRTPSFWTFSSSQSLPRTKCFVDRVSVSFYAACLSLCSWRGRSVRHKPTLSCLLQDAIYIYTILWLQNSTDCLLKTILKMGNKEGSYSLSPKMTEIQTTVVKMRIYLKKNSCILGLVDSQQRFQDQSVRLLPASFFLAHCHKRSLPFAPTELFIAFPITTDWNLCNKAVFP